MACAAHRVPTGAAHNVQQRSLAMSARIPLDRIANLSVPVAWHEAVALAQQVAHAAAAGGRAIGLDSIVLTDVGTVEILRTSRAPFTMHPAVGTLGALLDRAQAPRELVALLDRPDAPANLVKELEFFMRPGGTEALASLAARAVAAEAEASQRAALDRLRESSQRDRRAGEDWLEFQPEANGKKNPKTASARRPLHVWVVGAAALAVVAAAAMLALAAARKGADTPDTSVNGDAAAPLPARSPVQQITEHLDALVDRGLASLGLVAENPAPTELAVPAVAPRSARRAAAARRPALETVARLAVVTSPPPVAAASAETPEFELTATAAGELHELGEDGAAVAPPILRWPQLPNEPGTVAVEPGWPYLELLINEIGTVDKVRLRAADSSFHARMLVSAAKAWVFHPAQQDGRPVKYVMKVPIITE